MSPDQARTTLDRYDDHQRAGLLLGSNPPGGPYGQTTVHTWRFSKPVIAPIFHAVNLGASYLDITGTTTTGAAITLSALAKNNAVELTGNRLNGGVVNDFQTVCTPDGTAPPLQSACGSFELGGGLVQQFTLTNVLGNVDLAGDTGSP